VVICMQRGADLHVAQLMPLPLTVSCFSKIKIGFSFLVPAHPGSRGKRAVKQVCVCVYYTMLHDLTVLHTHRRIGDRAFSVAQRRINHSANCAMARAAPISSPPPWCGCILASAMAYGITLFACCELMSCMLTNSPVMTSTKIDNTPATGLFAY